MLGLVQVGLVGACNVSGSNTSFGSGAQGSSGQVTPSTGSPAGTTNASTSAPGVASETDSSDTEPKFDLAPGAGGTTAADACKVGADGDAVVACSDVAPPMSFTPEVQWSWPGDGPYTQSMNIVLVANLTDDNGDGEIDLCDIPDIVVNAYASSADYDGFLFALDGATGALHWTSEDSVHGRVTGALGDIDGDGLPEIVAVAYPSGNIIAFEHDGSTKWVGANWPDHRSGAIALSDVDADGDVEILAGNLLLDHEGVLLRTLPDEVTAPGFGSASATADLDGDGDLELILGRSAYHHDGAEYYMQPTIAPGFPQIANLDDDPFPEVLVNAPGGISVLEHDGTIKYANTQPVMPPTDDFLDPFNTGNIWMRPSSIHDMTGDGAANFAVSARTLYTVYSEDTSVVWTAMVDDFTGAATGTAFDFLGDGTAEAMYADETNLFIFGDNGEVVLSVPRSSKTLLEYPVVADVDNDGSAEIVVTSSTGLNNTPQTAPTVQVIRDQSERWIQARRIWNQHTYHVTNVREDGTIPQTEPPSWTQLNTYRTNAQIVPGGGVCRPAG